MVFTYHEVVPRHSSYIYSIDAATLHTHVQFLAALPGPPYASPLITFDDGHASQHRYGLPILDGFRIRATFFVTAGWMANRAAYMSWSQVREIAAAGHDVQSHGWSHRLLTFCTPAELAEELRASRETLEDKLAHPVRSLSVPGGRWNRNVSRACAAAGYQRVYVSNPWLKPVSRDGAVHIGRAMVRNSTGVADLDRWLKAETNPFSPLRWVHPAKVLVRTVLSDAAYHRVWRALGRKQNREQIDQEYTVPSVRSTK